MLFGRWLPWEYGVRNLFRRPARSALTCAALALVVFLTLVVAAFVRGLEASLADSGEPDVVLVYALGAAGDVENSAIPANTADLLAASLPQIDARLGVRRAAPELCVAAQARLAPDGPGLFGVVRGVTPVTPLLRRRARLIEGAWPGPGEVLAGRLAAAKLGCDDARLAVGSSLWIEGRAWRVAGRFAAGGAAWEAEIWAPLADLQTALRRQDLSLVAVGLAPGAKPAAIQSFCKQRYDLGLQAVLETEHYAALRAHYRPVRALGWMVAGLVTLAGVFAGLNTMYGAVVGRTRELATLQALGFRRRAIALSLVQEATLLALAAALLASALALGLVNGAAARFTMGAFALRVDSGTLLLGCGAGALLGVLGALPPALKATRRRVADGLKAY